MAAMLLLLGLLWATPATGQTVSHVDVVRLAKAQVVNEARIDPDGPGPDPSQPECPRFEVTRRAAVMLAGEGAGLLDKPTGNRCRGFAVDIIAYRDGTIVDVLGNGNEGPSTPMWLINVNKVDPSRWRPPPPLETTTPAPAPTPPEPPPPAPPAPPAPTPPPLPTPSPVTANEIVALNARIDQVLYALEQLRMQGEINGAKTEHVEARLNEVVAGAKSLGVKMLPWLGMAAVGGACAAK